MGLWLVVGGLWLTLIRSVTAYGYGTKIRRTGGLAIGQRTFTENLSADFLKEPIAKDFRFKDQLRGSCGSVMDNIAEGFERGSKLEFINSLKVAKGEAGELKSQLYRGLNNGYFTIELFEELYELANRITKKLTVFINYFNKSTIKGQKFKERN